MGAHKRVLLSSAAMALGLVVTPALGQGLQIEEILVTSKVREESLQDVPLNITAFSADDIVKKGIVDVRDLAALTPSFTYYSGTGRADPTALVVRGLAPNTSDERYQGLSIFVDGIFQSGQLTSVDLSDLERIEVIKGPQSATFGRATYAGAIDYVTRTPTDNEITSRLLGRWSTNRGNNNHNVSLRVNFPIVEDKMWASVTGTSLRRGELGKNPADNSPIGVEETAAIGVILYTEPTDNFSAKLRFALDRDRDGLPLIYVSEPPEWIADGANTLTLFDGSVWIDGKVPDTHLGRAGGGEFLSGDRPVEGGRDRDRYFTSLVMSYDLDNGAELSYRGGYFWDKVWANTDFYFRSGINDPFFSGSVSNRKSRVVDGTGSFFDSLFQTFFNVGNQEEFENTSHQIRYTSAADERFRYTFGGYYFFESSTNTRALEDSDAGNPTGLQRGVENARNLAGFFGLQYDVNDQFEVEAEGRIAKDKVFQDACDFCEVNNTVDSTGAPADPPSDSRTLFSPRITLNYKPNDDQLLYAYWSRGWKSARYNTGATSRFLPTAVPERLDNFEIGAKNTLLDGRAVVNVAAYYMDVKNQQAFFPVPNPLTGGTTTQSGVGNFGDSRIYGFEIEANAIVAEGLSVSGAIGMNDHQFTSDGPPLNDTQLFQDPVTGETRSIKGLTTVNTAKWTGSASVDYTRPISGGKYDLTLRADATYRSKIFVDRANLAYFPSSVRVNTKATISTDMWDISLFGRDIFDDRTPDGAGLSGTSGCLNVSDPANASLGFQTNQRCLLHAPPRGAEFGVEAIVNF